MTLDEELQTGQYAMRTTGATKHSIDWQLFLRHANKDSWECLITHEIMEGRVTALDEWELESWAKKIDSNFGNVNTDEDTGEWMLTNQQYARASQHTRSAEEWFRTQPLCTRLHLLTSDGWLTQAVRLYS